MSEFTVYPAIDLRRGRVVRLKEGDPRRQTEYSTDPAQVARRWLAAGAHWLHVVNLDGAFGHTDTANRAALAQVLDAARQAGARVQFGGGLRTPEAVDQALSAGVERAVLATLAIDRPGELPALLARWGAERIAVSLDARSGMVQVRGWQADSGMPALTLARRLAGMGLHHMVYTDISRDGLQSGLNLPATQQLAAESGLAVIASGGVHGLEDVAACRESGLAGVIVGRALYEGAIDPYQLFSGPGKEES
jgi:phosphoribosylformimino-5-aminoimidazole carboxamide ribotide isomerase